MQKTYRPVGMFVKLGKQSKRGKSKKPAWLNASLRSDPVLLNFLRVILAGGRLKAMLSPQHRSRTFPPVPWLILSFLIAILLLNGCGMGSKNPPPTATVGFAFVTNSGS